MAVLVRSGPYNHNDNFCRRVRYI